MAFLDVSLAQSHLRTDDYVDVYVEAACEYVSGLTGNDYSAEEAPWPVKAAALLVVADLYENREASSPVELKENPAVMRLLTLYRKW